jgi:two-component system nitrogen regulation sensor histidine kinase NtrY
MALNLTGPPPRPAPSPEPPPAPPVRRPLRDNPGLILFWIALLVAALAAMVAVADRSAQLSPDFLSEVVLSALAVADLTILFGLLFVLARNVIKLLVERRRGLPFARFRSKLVLALLGMTLVPTLLVLFVGSELIRNSASRWFSAPIDDVLSAAREVAADYYRERQEMVEGQAARLATELAAVDLSSGELGGVRDLVAPDVTDGQVDLVEIYRVADVNGARTAIPIVDVASPSLPPRYSRAGADRLAQQVLGGQAVKPPPEPVGDAGELVRAAHLVRGADGAPVGVVLASDYLGGDLARNSRRIVDAYEGYRQLRVLQRPLAGVYLSFFLMMTLLVLVSATWMGLYLAKRITRPVHLLAAGARQIAAGHLDHRIEPETRDEFGGLVEAFNAMAGDLAASQRRLERSRLDLEHKNVESEQRRRYIETILERIATGVISLDAQGRVSTVNGAAMRLLKLDALVAGRPLATVLGREDLAPLAAAIARATRARTPDHTGQEVALTVDGRELHLAVAGTRLVGDGEPEGTVVVFDDVTPLIRAQKVAAWRDVARRLAHEVKNPLTPIQLSAERLRRHFASAPEPQRTLVEECSATIVQEVESLKQLVDEFSQFARMPAPRTVATDLNALLRDALGLYRGIFTSIALEPRLADALPPVRVDPEQLRRVVINLVDNAVEAITSASPEGAGTIVVETQHDAANGVVRVSVTDDGPGVPEADRGRLFLPYYSTKQRGSGLGLAIVRRIIVEHGGSIEATDHSPRGTRMTIELPA